MSDVCGSIFNTNSWGYKACKYILGEGTSRCGDISEACQDKSPKYSLIEPPTDKYDYSNPKTVTYKIHGIANCDWTLDNIEVNAYFDPNTNIPTRAALQKGTTFEGHETLTAVFQYKFTKQLQGRIPVYIKGANGKKTDLYLYFPTPKDTSTTTKTQCEYANYMPSISTISINPKSANGLYPIGSDITIEASATDCDGLSNGANLSAHLRPYATAYLEMPYQGNVGNHKVFSKKITVEKQTKSFCVTVSDKARSTSAEKCMDVTVIPASSSSSSQPSAVIGSGLGYSYHVGDTASNITAYSDDSKASFKWTVTRPDGKTADTYTKQTISSYNFSSSGTYYFKLEVTAADGKTKTTTSRSVNVYPKSTLIPSAVISNLSYSYYVGDTATSITGYSDDSGATFAWIVTNADGTLSNYTGKTISSYTFNQQGNVNFKLIVTASDGKTTNAYNQSVGVYKNP